MRIGAYEVYDISVGVSNSTVTWTGDPRPNIELEKTLARDGSNVSRISIGAHTATHVDAPLHFVEGGDSIDRVPLDKLIGPARVVDMRGRKAISLSDVESADLKGVERILFKTDNWGLWLDNTFHESFCYVETPAAEFLARQRLKLVGVDYLGVEKAHNPGHPTHKALLAAGVVVLEGCNLADVPPGDYEIVCLPLKLLGTEAAPARVILRKPVH